MKIKRDIAVSDSGLVFNPMNGESYSVNPIGMEIFNLLKEQKGFNEISKKLKDKFEVEDSTLEKDFLDFTSMLKQYELLEDEA
ncbi:MAG: PqqD family protein [Bacteroidetes bacterium]|nr:PqqD family protein [Bacteroidota bacterium]